MLDKEIVVSVIVPCYNYAHYLGEALDSVLAQTYQNWQCIIINDGSPDNTEEVAMNYCEKDNRFKYFNKENGGHSAARNFGVSQSSGKYILPLDPDDKIAYNYLEKAIELFESDNTIKLITGEVQCFGEENQKHSFKNFDIKQYLVENYISISTLFLRNDFDNVKGFDENMLYFEDWDLFIKIIGTSGKVVELPFVGLYYRKKKDSLFALGNIDIDRKFRDLTQLYYNNIMTYQKYFSSPIELIQENEKLNRIVNLYQQTKTYRAGVMLKKMKRFFRR